MRQDRRSHDTHHQIAGGRCLPVFLPALPTSALLPDCIEDRGVSVDEDRDQVSPILPYQRDMQPTSPPTYYRRQGTPTEPSKYTLQVNYLARVSRGAKGFVSNPGPYLNGLPNEALVFFAIQTLLLRTNQEHLCKPCKQSDSNNKNQPIDLP